MKPALKPALAEHGAVFRDHLVGAVHSVGGGLPLAGAGVEVAAQELGGLHGHQLAAVSVLADNIVGGGEVQHHRGTGGSQFRGGGHGCPHILTDLHAHHKVLHPGAAEHQPAKRRPLAAKRHGRVLLRGGGKLALFVKLAVVGKVHLGNYAQNLSFLYYCRAVIQFVVFLHRKAHSGEDLQRAGCFQHGSQGFLGAAEKGILVKQVAAGVAGQAQLRQHQHLHAPLFSVPHHGKGLFRVIMAVRKAQLGGAAGNSDESVFHKYDLPAFFETQNRF